MFGIETDVQINRTAQGVEISLGSRPEMRYFTSEADAQRVLGRERVFWTAAFAISAGLTLVGLTTINSQVQISNLISYGVEVGEIFRGLVETFVGGIAVRSTLEKMEQRNEAMYSMQNYHFP